MKRLRLWAVCLIKCSGVGKIGAKAGFGAKKDAMPMMHGFGEKAGVCIRKNPATQGGETSVGALWGGRR